MLTKIVISISLLFVSSVFAGGFVVVANNSISEDSISMSDLKGVYSGAMTSFGKASINLVYLKTGAAADAFFKDVVGSSVQSFEKVALEKTLSGALNSSPEKKDSADDMINYVASKNGAIGFIDEADKAKAAGKVKVLSLK